GAAEPGANLVVGDRLAVYELFKELIVLLGDAFDHDLAPAAAGFLQVGGDFGDVELCAQRLIAPQDALHFDQIHEAFVPLFAAEGILDGYGIGLQTLPDSLYGVLVIGAHAIHLVDEADTRDGVLIGLPPHGLGLRLH